VRVGCNDVRRARDDVRRAHDKVRISIEDAKTHEIGGKKGVLP